VLLGLNEIPVDEFARRVFTTLVDYGNPIIVSENDPYGRAILDRLQKQGYSNLFSEDPSRPDKLGYTKSQQRRIDDLMALEARVRNRHVKIPYREAVLEMFNFMPTTKGDFTKYVAAKGTHDDVVMAMRVCHDSGQPVFCDAATET